eukprot:9715343-Heterocapsa_arctica.AAC.1
MPSSTTRQTTLPHRGAKVHPSPSEEVSSKWQSDLADLQSYAKLLNTVWPLWPKLAKVEPRPKPDLPEGGPRRRRPRRSTNPGAPQLCWSFGCGRWQCSACCLTTYT